MKTVWVSIYKCNRCGKEREGRDRYNDEEASRFPYVDAQKTISHQCTPVCKGIASLVGLSEVLEQEKQVKDGAV